MNILKNKHIAILGLGKHGGGISSTRFAIACGASNISIFDKAGEAAIETMLTPLAHQRHLVDVRPYEKSLLAQCDIVIKNPAIPHHTDILKHIKHIETDISLYYHTQQTPTWMVTGTKGKSSVCTALYNLHLKETNPEHITLAGNITNSPLNILLPKEIPEQMVKKMPEEASEQMPKQTSKQAPEEIPEKIILELSSFQLGDLALVSAPPYQYMEIMILTNIMPDHQNYYDSMQSYVADKLLPFQHLSPSASAILPFPSAFSKEAYHKKDIRIEGDMLSYTMYGNTISLPAKQCYFHSETPLPSSYAGIYSTKDGLWSTTRNTEEAQLLISHHDIPSHIPTQNICIIMAVSQIERERKPAPETQCTLSSPKTKQAWNDIFCIPHRKEFVATIEGRVFYNDSAATIPQAIQLDMFSEQNIHLIAGGANKNLSPDDFIEAIKNAHALYILDGTFSEQVIPKLQALGKTFFGPFSSLQDALHCAFQQSKEKDIILLSPGCASFGMFAHEFERGDTFKHLVQALKQTHAYHSPLRED